MPAPLRDFLGRLLPTIGTDVATDAELAARARRVLPAPWVGARNYLPHDNTTAAVGTSRVVGGYAYDVDTVRLVYAHFGSTPAGEVTPAGPITFRAGFEPVTGGPIYPVTFGARRAVTMDAGSLVSDPISVRALAGQSWAARTYLVSGTAHCPSGSRGSFGDGFTAGADLTDTGAGAVAGDAVWRFGPVGVIGHPVGGGPVATVGIVGDSIPHGQGDDDGYADTAGFAVRALGLWTPGVTPLRGWVNAAVAGFSPHQWPTGHRYRWPLVEDCMDLLVSAGVNAVKSGQTTAAIAGSLLGMWRTGAAAGQRVWACTITPASTGTFGTVGGQTKHGNDAARVGVNTWLRAGGPIDPATGAYAPLPAPGALIAGRAGHPLAGVFDTADAVESGRDSGVWKANLTADGTHPNAAGHAAMATKVDAASFATP